MEKKGLKPLNLENLRLLERLVEKKDYGTSKKAQKAKIKLLNKINVINIWSLFSVHFYVDEIII